MEIPKDAEFKAMLFRDLPQELKGKVLDLKESPVPASKIKDDDLIVLVMCNASPTDN